MKFESKFGIGEIVIRGMYAGERYIADESFEVIQVIFSRDSTDYVCRSAKGQGIVFKECELEGDPDYDQEIGSYPDGYE